jgi:hypothetical protein
VAKSSSASARRAPASRTKKRPAASATQRGPLAVGVVVVALAAIITALVLIKVNSQSTSVSTSAKAVPVSVFRAITHVPTSALTQAGYSPAIPLTEKLSGSPAPLTSSGKPEVLFIGADYCPFCAAERWPIISALSKFGTFSNLHLMTSSATDSYANTHTFTFYKSSYTSKYISFVPVEWSTNQTTTSSNNFSGYSILQPPTKAQLKLFTTYDAAPYTTTSGSIPFIDFGNKYVQIGASYTPQVLSGLNWTTIAGALSLPTSSAGQAIDQTTNVITATICKMTGDQPANVCGTPLIKSLTTQLGG